MAVDQNFSHKGPVMWKAFPYQDDIMSYTSHRYSHNFVCYALARFYICLQLHYNDVIMSAMASQITSHTIAYSTVYSSADQRKYQSSASLAFVRGIHRWPVNALHKGPVTRKMFPFDDTIMIWIPVIHCPCSAHDDVIKWNIFRRYWPFERGIHRSLRNSLTKGR